MFFFGLQDLAVMILWAIGTSAVVTGSKIGFPIRFAWCYVMPRFLWGMVQCPYCNAWWGGLVAGIIYSPSWDHWPAWIQVAFSACGIVRVLQAALLREGIAMFEDFEQAFNKRRDHGQ